MKKFPHLVKYFKYKGGDKFAFYKAWNVVFEDHFQLPKPDAAKWATMGYWAEKIAGGNFSQPGDLQCFTDGGNIKTGKDGLAIQMKKEEAKGRFWGLATGFTSADFHYTSGQLCSGDRFRFDEGIVEAKIKFKPVSGVVSIFYLLGE
jgi:beta-glucanase (GH16 family)